MASSEPLGLSVRFGPWAYSAGLCHLGQGREVPQFTLRVRSDRAVFHTPADRMVVGCSSSIRASLRLIRKGSASAITRASRFTRGDSFGAAKFALCYGPVSCRPFTDKDFYARAFTPGVASLGRRVSLRGQISQFPRPDFHRLDMQHYGLRPNPALNPVHTLTLHLNLARPCETGAPKREWIPVRGISQMGDFRFESPHPGPPPPCAIFFIFVGSPWLKGF